MLDLEDVTFRASFKQLDVLIGLNAFTKREIPLILEWNYELKMV